MRVAIDTETTGLNVWTGGRPFAVSMCWEDSVDEYDVFSWSIDPFTRRIIEDDAFHAQSDLVRAVCEDISIDKIFFNAGFDIEMLRAIGIEVRGRIEEVSFMARACGNIEFQYGLKRLGKSYLDISDADEERLHAATVRARRIAKRHDWLRAEDVQADYWMCREVRDRYPDDWATIAERVHLDVSTDPLEHYAGLDAVRTMQLCLLYEEGLADLGDDVRAVYEREMTLLPITMQMRRRGVRIDKQRLEELRADCQTKIADSLEKMRTATSDPEFNPNSHQQVCRMLYEGQPLRLAPLKKTKSGGPSVDAEAVVPYSKHELVKDLLTHRANVKALSSFFDKYSLLAEDTDDGYVLHPGFRQWGALTGRYTCGEPNLQQVSDPSTTNSRMAEYVVNVRQLFLPRANHVWLCPDYDQVEVIVFACVSGEPTMLDAIKRGVDIHSTTANKIWGGSGNPRAVAAAQRLLRAKGRAATESAAVDLLDSHGWDICAVEKSLDLKLWRKLAKTVTFTKIFGGGQRALMSWTGCTYEEATEMLLDYDASFPEMVDAMRRIQSEGAKRGWIANLWGRRLQVDRHAAYRAVNYIVQSTAADLMKDGMLKCAEYLQHAGIDGQIVLTVHDEIVFEIHKRHMFLSIIPALCNLMADHGGRLPVETPVSMDVVRTRWSEKEAA